MAKSKLLLYVLFFLLSLNVAFSTQVIINIIEDSTQTSLSGGSYSIQADGIIEITNPSMVSRIYDVIIPLDLDSLIGINKVGLDNSSDLFEFNYNEIKGYLIPPNTTVRFGYEIFGLVSYNLYGVMDSNQTVFEYYTESYDFSSSTILNLQKPQQENRSLVNSTRLVTAGIRNPTDFDYFASDLTVYKTDVANPFFDDGEILGTVYNLSIDPFEFREIDFFDYTSSDNSVYWVSSNILIDYNQFTEFTRQNRVQQQSAGGGGGGGGGGGSFDAQIPGFGVLDSLFIRKDVSTNLIRLNEPFTVTLRVVNVNNFALEDLVVYDEVPAGYEIKDVSSSVKISDGGKLEFEIDEIEEFGTYVITYTLVSANDLKGITYLKPAILDYDSNEYYSDGVLLVNQLLSTKKIFIQKEIEYEDDEFARVTLKVKNLGSLRLEDVLVVDEIEDSLIVKQISKVFHEERGVWKIKVLNAGEEWEVSYLVERNANLDNLPNIFGVDKSDVFGTIVSSEEIVTFFQEEPRTIERVGIGLAAFLLVIYLLF